MLFKGDTTSVRSSKSSKKKKSKKSKKRKQEKEASAEGGGGGSSSASSSGLAVVVKGKGRLITSGTTVHGKDTVFMSELEAGDALEVLHPNTLEVERRLVTMVISDMSMAITSAFSSDLISSTPFSFIKKPPELVDHDAERSSKRNRLLAEEKQAFGTYASGLGETFTYRVKKKSAYGGYKVVTETLGAGGSGQSRESLLNKRCGKKSDRFCY